MAISISFMLDSLMIVTVIKFLVSPANEYFARHNASVDVSAGITVDGRSLGLFTSNSS